MNYYCKTCGKDLGSHSWNGYQNTDDSKKPGDPGWLYYLCRKCHTEKALAETKEAILRGDYEGQPIDNNIPVTDGFYCPHCGEYVEPEFADDEYELLTDGIHDYTCPECGKKFKVNTSVSYYFESFKE